MTLFADINHSTRFTKSCKFIENVIQKLTITICNNWRSLITALQQYWRHVNVVRPTTQQLACSVCLFVVERRAIYTYLCDAGKYAI